MKLAEFFVSILFDGDQKAVEQYDGALNKMGRTLEGLKIAAVAFATERFINSTVEATGALQQFNDQTGISIERLQELQVAGELSGVAISAEQVASSVSALQQNLEQIRLGGGDVGGFQLLGIDVTGKDAIDIIDELRVKTKDLSNAQATNLVQRLGLGPEFITILRGTNSEFSKLVTQGLLSPEQRESVTKLGSDLAALRRSFSNLRDNLVAAFAPAFTVVFRVLTRATSALVDLAKWLTENSKIMAGMAASAGILLAAVSPMLRIFSVLALVLEDVQVYLAGGDSFIGRSIERWKAFGQVIKDFVLEPLMRLMEVLGSFSNGISSIGTSALNTISGGASSVASSVSNAFNNVFNINSQADANQVADSVVSQQQRQLNFALSDINNGNQN